MPAFLIRRVLQSLIVMLVMSVLVFGGLFVIGDPVTMMASPDATEAEQDAVRSALMLDRPPRQQYLGFVRRAATLDFGRSYLSGQPAMALILERLPATLELACVAIALALLVGVPLGLWAGLAPRALSSRAIMSGSVLGFSLPNFWVGLLLIMVFAVALGWLPAGGRGRTTALGPIELSLLSIDGWRHIILPATTIALAKASLMIRVTRAATREILPMEFVRFARAKGLSGRRILWVHVLRNVMIPILTIGGLEFGQVLAFAVVTESIFAWPGMGKLLLDSISNLDRPVVVGYLIMVVFFLVMLNLAIDVLYSLIDPRIRLQGQSQ